MYYRLIACIDTTDWLQCNFATVTVYLYVALVLINPANSQISLQSLHNADNN